MAEFDELDPLAKEDDEYKIFIKYTDEFEKQEKGSKNHKSGKATQIAIHNYLFKRDGICLPQNPEVKIQEVKTKMNLLYLLKIGVDQNRKEYSIRDLDAVLKISSNAVVGAKTSDDIKNAFNKFAQKNKNLRFAVIVLSERLSYPDKIVYPRVFTLVIRKKKAHKLYLIETIIDRQKTKDLRKPIENGLEDLLSFLKGK